MNKYKLKDVCYKIYSGGTPSTKENKYWNGSIPWLSSSESGQDFVYKANSFITEIAVEETSTKFVSKNTVVMATAGEGKTRGQVCYLKIDACINQSMIALEVDKNKIDSLFLFYYLKNSYSRIRSLSDATGVRGSLSGSLLKEFYIFIPELEKQKKISDLLYKLDKKIQNNNKQIQTLDSLAKTIYDYWFVQFDFPNEDGKPYKSSGGKMVWNEELKREIPEGWDVVRYGDIMSFAKGKIPVELSEVKTEKCCMPYITINVANQGPYQYCSPQTMVSCKGETIMVMDGAASGDVYVGNKGALGSTFSMISTKRTDITDAFIYRLLKYSSMIYKRANTGSTVPHANRNFIEKMYVALPRDCRKLINVFNVINDKIIAAQEENRELISLRDFLLPMLMNGQVKVGKESA